MCCCRDISLISGFWLWLKNCWYLEHSMINLNSPGNIAVCQTQEVHCRRRELYWTLCCPPELLALHNHEYPTPQRTLLLPPVSWILCPGSLFRSPLIQNHHHLALQDVGDKMVVMQDGGDLVTILPCSQISLKNGMLPISTKQNWYRVPQTKSMLSTETRLWWCFLSSQKENKN